MNTAVAASGSPTQPVVTSAPAMATVPALQTPVLTIAKASDIGLAIPGFAANVFDTGRPVTYTYTVN